ncbi:glycosyltransferase [Xylanimonas ulmi]|uniref:glycosyltransferase n=1 Tax=Xylanimonas ulmi TaxID=228973 RepID=UPI00102C4A21|nr:hypothetical protein [Xylanibacterium ulmi]
MPVTVIARVQALASGRRYIAPARLGVPDAPVRLLVAPANFAGQGHAWAHAAERSLPGVAARNLAFGTAFGFPSDVDVPPSVAWSRAWARSARRDVYRYSHVLVEAERALLPGVERDVSKAIADLRGRGVSVATVCHGSDIRSPSAHADREPWSPFALDTYKDAQVLQAQAERNRALLEDLRAADVPAFVSTPDLLLDVPWGTWLPVVVDVDAWSADTVPLAGEVPVVVHAPSRSALKGTDVIDPVLRGLHRSGLIEYRSASGLDRDGMQKLYRGADVVVDQLRMGIYGVAACEALAAGRVVISQVSDQVRAAARDASGQDLPVVQATPDTLEETIRGVLDDVTGARNVASRGPGFVRQLHDGRASARVLRPFVLGAAS